MVKTVCQKFPKTFFCFSKNTGRESMCWYLYLPNSNQSEHFQSFVRGVSLRPFGHVTLVGLAEQPCQGVYCHSVRHNEFHCPNVLPDLQEGHPIHLLGGFTLPWCCMRQSSGCPQRSAVTHQPAGSPGLWAWWASYFGCPHQWAVNGFFDPLSATALLTSSPWLGPLPLVTICSPLQQFLDLTLLWAGPNTGWYHLDLDVHVPTVVVQRAPLPCCPAWSLCIWIHILLIQESENKCSDSLAECIWSPSLWHCYYPTGASISTNPLMM